MELPKEIQQTKLLLAEGADAYYFFIWAYQALGLGDIQVLDFGGINDLRLYLKQLTLLYGYENVETILIARDAESDATAARASVQQAIRDAGLTVPPNPFEFSSGKPRVAFMLFPGYTGDSASGIITLQNGTLEDLCLQIAKNKNILHCVDQYVECLRSAGERVQHPHKAKVHAYLAGLTDFVGLKIGEATKAGAWDLLNVAFEPFRQMITSM